MIVVHLYASVRFQGFSLLAINKFLSLIDSLIVWHVSKSDA